MQISKERPSAYALVVDRTLFHCQTTAVTALAKATEVSGRLNWPLLQLPVAQALREHNSVFFLACEPSGWVAYWAQQPCWKGLWFDYTHSKALQRLAHAGPRSEGVIKALGRAKPTTVLDCTAGSGQDSLLLATSGARVTALERHPLVYLLLEDALWRARQHGAIQTVAERVQVQHLDASNSLIGADRGQFDVIYCDPMFPARNKSALVTKTMQFFHALLDTQSAATSTSSPDAEQLVQQALRIAGRRVIVKRPVKAPPVLVQPKPDHSVQSGKLVRFDIYLTA